MAPTAYQISRQSMPTMRLRRRKAPLLNFRQLTLADIPRVKQLLHWSNSRTCDYTIGGIYMWIDYFRYRFCIVDDTLFLSGVAEDNPRLTAFSAPIGPMPLEKSLELLEEYCVAYGMPLRFSAVPADRVNEFLSLRSWQVSPLADWGDYLYDLSTLASLSGKKMAKKRNHVNRFEADNPGAHFDAMTPADIEPVISAYGQWIDSGEDSDTALQERRMTIEVIRNLSNYGFDGGVLRLSDGTPVAFTLAEVIGDTAYVHIEKMDHRVAGAGEAVNKYMAAYLLDRYPQLIYANREEDCGDPGLRFAKESYHPVKLLDKYNLRAN